MNIKVLFSFFRRNYIQYLSGFLIVAIYSFFVLFLFLSFLLFSKFDFSDKDKGSEFDYILTYQEEEKLIKEKIDLIERDSFLLNFFFQNISSIFLSNKIPIKFDKQSEEFLKKNEINKEDLKFIGFEVVKENADYIVSIKEKEMVVLFKELEINKKPDVIILTYFTDFLNFSLMKNDSRKIKDFKIKFYKNKFEENQKNSSIFFLSAFSEKELFYFFSIVQVLIVLMVVSSEKALHLLNSRKKGEFEIYLLCKRNFFIFLCYLFSVDIIFIIISSCFFLFIGINLNLVDYNSFFNLLFFTFTFSAMIFSLMMAVSFISSKYVKQTSFTGSFILFLNPIFFYFVLKHLEVDFSIFIKFLLNNLISISLISTFVALTALYLSFSILKDNNKLIKLQ